MKWDGFSPFEEIFLENADAFVQRFLDTSFDHLGLRRHLGRRLWIQERLGDMGLSGLSWFPCLSLVSERHYIL